MRNARGRKNRVSQAPRMASQAVGRTRTAPEASCRRIKSRPGGPGRDRGQGTHASRLVYRMLGSGTENVPRSLEEDESPVRAERERNLRNAARSPDFEPMPAAAPSPP